MALVISGIPESFPFEKEADDGFSWSQLVTWRPCAVPVSRCVNRGFQLHRKDTFGNPTLDRSVELIQSIFEREAAAMARERRAYERAVEEAFQAFRKPLYDQVIPSALTSYGVGTAVAMFASILVSLPVITVVGIVTSLKLVSDRKEETQAKCEAVLQLAANIAVNRLRRIAQYHAEVKEKCAELRRETSTLESNLRNPPPWLLHLNSSSVGGMQQEASRFHTALSNHFGESQELSRKAQGCIDEIDQYRTTRATNKDYIRGKIKTIHDQIDELRDSVFWLLPNDADRDQIETFFDRQHARLRDAFSCLFDRTNGAFWSLKQIQTDSSSASQYQSAVRPARNTLLADSGEDYLFFNEMLRSALFSEVFATKVLAEWDSALHTFAQNPNNISDEKRLLLLSLNTEFKSLVEDLRKGRIEPVSYRYSEYFYSLLVDVTKSFFVQKAPCFAQRFDLLKRAIGMHLVEGEKEALLEIIERVHQRHMDFVGAVRVSKASQCKIDGEIDSIGSILGTTFNRKRKLVAVAKRLRELDKQACVKGSPGGKAIERNLRDIELLDQGKQFLSDRQKDWVQAIIGLQAGVTVTIGPFKWKLKSHDEGEHYKITRLRLS